MLANYSSNSLFSTVAASSIPKTTSITLATTSSTVDSSVYKTVKPTIPLMTTRSLGKTNDINSNAMLNGNSNVHLLALKLEQHNDKREQRIKGIMQGVQSERDFQRELDQLFASLTANSASASAWKVQYDNLVKLQQLVFGLAQYNPTPAALLKNVLLPFVNTKFKSLLADQVRMFVCCLFGKVQTQPWFVHYALICLFVCFSADV
jgi:hypothetical protein